MMSYRLTVLGTGYMGTVQAACLANLGFEVLGLDTDPDRVRSLNKGAAPFYEPGLQDLLGASLRSGRLGFTDNYARVADFGDVHFICVGTPQQRGSYHADLSQLNSCLEILGPLLSGRSALVVGRCTVPVGTALKVSQRLSALASDAELAWCPEFIREGHAVQDTLSPIRIVVGVQSDRAEHILREIHAEPISAGSRFLVTDLATAELVKGAANAFLATKISFINSIADVCDAVGADATTVAAVLGADPRIGHGGLRPGLGFGGGCLPKDLRAFIARAEELGVAETSAFLRRVDFINVRRRVRMVDRARDVVGGDFTGTKVAALGASFKPGSDDIRDSPALTVATTIAAEGAIVTVHDPEAIPQARQACPQLCYADTIMEAVRGAHVVLLMTDWPEYSDADPDELGQVAAKRNIVDGRYALSPGRWGAASWHYVVL
jgi:UDPglucose 6-dehydrogenase